VINIDLVENKEADFNTVATGSGSLTEQGHAINESLSAFLGSDKLCAIFCVAGGWAGGNAGSKGKNIVKERQCDIHMRHETIDFLKSSELMIHQSVNSSLIAAHLASKHLKA
jgi:dihydropteridine reductase